MIKPPKLKAGDRLAAITLSWAGAGTFPHRFEAGKRQLEALYGVEVVPTRHALRDADWIYRHPQARADDLMTALEDASIQGIISNIGGEESIRLLPYLDLDLIRRHPKVFMGFSDTTVSLLAFHKAGVVSFYGPSILAGFDENGGLFPYTAESVRRTLFSADPIGVIAPNTEAWTVEFLDWADPTIQRPREMQPTTGWRWLQGQGVVQGRLLGGCIEVLDWVRGTSVWPDVAAWEGAMLFLETSEEAPSPEAVARMLRSLAAVGALARVAGILVGRPGGHVPPADFEKYDAAIQRVVAEELGLTDLPIITNMDFGHTDPKFVLPLGVLAQIDCDRHEFSIAESAVA